MLNLFQLDRVHEDLNTIILFARQHTNKFVTRDIVDSVEIVIRVSLLHIYMHISSHAFPEAASLNYDYFQS
jgi:hypothetical protein